MSDLGISFALRFEGFDFGPVETVLLVVAAATALVSIFELLRLSRRERLKERIANLRGTIAMPSGAAGTARPRGVPWYDRLGDIIAKSPLVGAAERRRLADKLSGAGISGPGRLATFLAIRFFLALAGGLLLWLASGELDLQGDLARMRYVALALGLGLGWRIPDIIVSRLAARRRLRFEIGFPDALDLLIICAEAGLGLEQAVGQVARDMRLAIPEVAAEFAITEAEMHVMTDRHVALENLAARTGLETLRGMVAVLNQSMRFGTPLSDALRQLAAEARTVRLARLEERAARLSVTLLLPVMGFILPSLFLVVGGPIVLRAIDILGPIMSNVSL